MREKFKVLTEKCKKGKQAGIGNRGSTLVIVLTVVAFLSILAVVVTSAASTNYRMKIINKQSQKSFYTSEDALDEIYASLGKLSMETFDEAYNEELSSVVESLPVGGSTVAITKSNLTKNQDLRKNYTYSILEKLKLVDTTKEKDEYLDNDFQTVYYDSKLNKEMTDRFVAELNSYLEGEGKTDDENAGLRVVSVDRINITAENTSITEKENVMPMDLKQYTLYFTNCRVEYLNERSYYSNITFDGKMAMPDIYIDFSTENTDGLTTFADYALVGNTGITVNGNLSLNGNAYAGKGAADKGGVIVSGGSVLNIGNGITLVSGGDITVNDGTLTTNNSNLWCQSIVTLGNVGSAVNISGNNGSTFVKDDLQVEGDFSTVTLDGSYYGYSYQGNNTEEGNHNNSSAIIVNGEKSSVNMTALKALVLGGRAYIDFAGFSADKAYTTGESVSLTAAQEMYLIPSYMMTREKEVDGKTVVNHVSNPIVGDTTGVKVNINKENFFGWDYLYGSSLDDSIRSDSDLYTTKEVIKDGKTITYYYFKFKDDKAVSDYVKALFDDTFYDELTKNIVAESGENHIISEYNKCRAYIRSIITANLTAQSSDLIGTKEGATVYTNGQMINASFKDGEESLGLNNTDNDYIVEGNAVSTDGFLLEAMDLSNRYDLLSMILTMPGFSNNDGSRYYLYSLGNSVIIDNESVNISNYEKNNVFENIISVEELNKLVAGEAHNEVMDIAGYETGSVCYITNGGTTVIGEAPLNFDYGLIITTGDVIVKKDFTGSILAKGNIYIEGNVTVKSDEKLVREILMRDNEISDILNTGKNLTDGDFSAEGMTYKDFVDFINWRKTEDVSEEVSEETTKQD